VCLCVCTYALYAHKPQLRVPKSVCCSVLQCFRVSQCVAVCCSTLQCVYARPICTVEQTLYSATVPIKTNKPQSSVPKPIKCVRARTYMHSHTPQSKEPHFPSKEPYIPPKQPYILSKEPYIPPQDPCIFNQNNLKFHRPSL